MKLNPKEILLSLLLILSITGGMLYASTGFNSVGFVGSLRSNVASGGTPPNSLVTNLELALGFQDGNSSAISPTSYVNSYVGTNNNTVLITNAGGVNNDGNAIYISANSEYVSFAAADAFARTGSITVSGWYNLSVSNATKTLVVKGADTGSGTFATNAEYSFQTTSASAVNLVVGSGLGASSTLTILSSLVPVGGTGSWFHLTAVLTNGVGWTVYTNGVKRNSSGSVSNQAYNSSGPLRIARTMGSTSQTYNDMKSGPFYVFSRPLSPAEVFNLHTNNVAGIYDPRLMIP